MKKTLLIVIALILGIKYGVGYLFSPKFQAYGDRTKAPWTCEFNNFIGHMLMVLSRYDESITYFTYTVNRCPDSDKSEVAEYEIAECLASSGSNSQAGNAYRIYAEKYKGSRRAQVAEKAADIMQGR